MWIYRLVFYHDVARLWFIFAGIYACMLKILLEFLANNVVEKCSMSWYQTDFMLSCSNKMVQQNGTDNLLFIQLLSSLENIHCHNLFPGVFTTPNINFLITGDQFTYLIKIHCWHKCSLSILFDLKLTLNRRNKTNTA